MKSLKCTLFLLIIISFISCKEDGSLTIARQFGLAYAPVEVMKSMGFLEEEMPGFEIKWVQLANTAAIREAALAGDADAGFLGIPPFLIARDQGMPWKLLCGLSRTPLGLVVEKDRWNSLNDIPGNASIALPQPGSIQHILLSMALKREKGDSSFLNNHLVSLKHPDGMNALLSGAVDGHFTSPPYIFQETAGGGFETLLTGEEAFGGPFTFIAAMVTEKGASRIPGFPEALIRALNRSIQYMNDHPGETLDILSSAYGLDRQILEDYLSRPGMVYSTEIQGVDGFISFMAGEGLLKNIRDSEGVYYR